MWLKTLFRSLCKHEDGATAIEYAVMLSLICGAVIGSVGVSSNALKDSFNKSGTAVNNVLGPSP